jgi:hypothetical protein
MEIKAVNKGVCVDCSKKAKLLIDSKAYCGACADPLLLKQIRRCADAVTHAAVKFSILPLKSLKIQEGWKKKG